MLQVQRLGPSQLIDALIDPHEFGAELLEAAEGGHLAPGLVDLGGIGERLLDGLAPLLLRETHLGPWPGWLSLAQAQLGLPHRRKET